MAKRVPASEGAILIAAGRAGVVASCWVEGGGGLVDGGPRHVMRSEATTLRQEGQKLGQRRVQADLTAKGVASATVGEAVGAAYEGVDEVKLAQEYCARKRMKKPSDEKEQARAMGRLLRAGFSAGTVFKVLREWGVEVEEVDVEEEG